MELHFVVVQILIVTMQTLRLLYTVVERVFEKAKNAGNGARCSWNGRGSLRDIDI